MYLRSNIKSECCGCLACIDICPKKCITFVEDKNGFIYPRIDSTLCINCGLCKKICPNGFEKWISNLEIKSYIGVSDKETVFNSSSGGAFTSIYKYLIKNNYFIYGAAFDKEMNVRHILARTEQECEKMRKSKYVQSNTKGVYSEIDKYLKNDKKVCFSGTPCQCAALWMYLDAKKTERDKLLTINVLCHGVPNLKTFKKHISEKEKRKKDKIISYTFRNKETIKGKNGLCTNSRSARIVYASGKEEIVDQKNDAYLKGYYNRLFLRDSCYECVFARQERASDITIADAWNIQKIKDYLDPNLGVSLVLANTKNGKRVISNIKKYIDIEEVDLEWALNSQSIMKKPTSKRKSRSVFFFFFNKIDFDYSVKIATYKPFAKRLLSFIKNKAKLLMIK